MLQTRLGGFAVFIGFLDYWLDGVIVEELAGEEVLESLH
jgi:hypothetical protein